MPHPIPGPSFPAPTAYVWLSLSRLLRDGSLPPKSGVFMIFGGALAILIAILKIRAKTRAVWYAKWILSGDGHRVRYWFPQHAEFLHCTADWRIHRVCIPSET
jgi:hypothetical protein